MAKEIYISSTPHETRLAIVEDEQLTEIYYERENEYTLAGSIYKGKVTRVLPGMQSAFVELGLERDAFLYVTDFLEEQDEPAEFERAPQQRNDARRPGAALPADSQQDFSIPAYAETSENEDGISASPAAAGIATPREDSADGVRRLRGRRGRRRGRGGRRDSAAPATTNPLAHASVTESEEDTLELTDTFDSPKIFDTYESEEFQEEIHEDHSSVASSIKASAPPAQAVSRLHEGRNQDRQRQPAPTPILLPGESLARFGSAPPPPAERLSIEAMPEEEYKPEPKITHTLKPSTLIDSPIEWDGGPLLPGETLSRHRNPPKATPATTEPPTASQLIEEEWVEEILPESEVEQIEAAADEEHAFEPATVDTVHQHPKAFDEDASATHNVLPDPPRYFDLRSLFGIKKKKPAKKPVSPFTAGTGLVEEEFDENDEDYDFSRIGAHADDADIDELHEETVVSSSAISQPVRGNQSAGRNSAEVLDENGFARVARPVRSSGRDRNGRRDGRGSERGADRGGDRNVNRSGGDRSRRGPGSGRKNTQGAAMPVITELLKPGQEILVQIAKEPIAKKGARITSHIALPGRFLVFMPTVDHVGVSRRIASDEERQRLKHILLSEKGDATGGFIVRTAAEGASEDELRSDLRFLIHLWNDIKSRSDASKAPALIYHDLNLVERVLRDQVSDNFSSIWVDTEAEYERVVRFMQRFQPSLVRHVKLYSKQTPLFEQFGITEEINKALKTKVWLKSGGSIVINQTEALVAIDINTGKYVGKTARLEDTIVKTNLDAIPEIVRQIRLRDLGGIIVIDFIDMDERRNRHKVLAALEEELKKDRAPSKVLQFNDFGLVAITRKRVKQSLERTLSTPCTTCAGTGMTKSPVTVCNELFVELRKMHKELQGDDILLRVHPEVVKELKAPNANWLSGLEEVTGKTILVKSDPTLHPEQFDIH